MNVIYKKYRTKIDTPWAKKCAIFEHTAVTGRGFLWAPHGVFGPHFYEHPEEYPDLFEPIEEKTPKERLAEYIKDAFLSWKGLHDLEVLSKKLIAAGLDPDKLEGQK